MEKGLDEIMVVGTPNKIHACSNNKRICCICGGPVYTSDEWGDIKKFMCLPCARKHPDKQIEITEQTVLHTNTVLGTHLPTSFYKQLAEDYLKKQ